MLLKIGYYEVEVTVKTVCGNPCTDRDTQYLLNDVSIAYRQAASYYMRNGRAALADDLLTKSNEIYDALDAAGFYNSQKEIINMLRYRQNN